MSQILDDHLPYLIRNFWSSLSHRSIGRSRNAEPLTLMAGEDPWDIARFHPTRGNRPHVPIPHIKNKMGHLLKDFDRSLPEFVPDLVIDVRRNEGRTSGEMSRYTEPIVIDVREIVRRPTPLDELEKNVLGLTILRVFPDEGRSITDEREERSGRDSSAIVFGLRTHSDGAH